MAQNVTTGENQKDKPVSSESDDTTSKGPTVEASALSRFKTRAANGTNKPISPFLRAKGSNNSSDPAEGNKNTNNAADNHNDVAAKLSFKEEETNVDSKVDAETKVINGSIE